MFTKDELDILITAIEYGLKNAEACDYYPSYELKQKHVANMKELLRKLREAKRGIE